MSVGHLFVHLAPLASPEVVDDASFKKIVKHSCNALLGLSDQDKVLGDEGINVDAAVLKSCFGGMCALLAELSKANATEQTAKSTLEDLNLPPERVDLICQALQAKGKEFRDCAALSKFSLPTITGVKWRVDYSMRSNRLDKINSPMFMVQFLVEDGASIDCWCTRAQLQDLISTMRDAVKEVDRCTGQA